MGTMVSNEVTLWLYNKYMNVLVTLPPSLILNTLVMLVVIWINVIQERY